jgi:hypothetical protein
MAVVQGQRVTYGYASGGTGYDAETEALDISSMLDILRPVDVPLLTLIGRDSLLDGPAQQVKHEWLEDEYRGQSTVSSGLNNTTDPVTVTLTTAAHAAYFRGTGGNGSPADYTAADSVSPGDVVRLWDANGEEIGIVTAVTATTIDIDRSQLGSTPVSHTTSCNIVIIGTLQPQGLTTVGQSRTTTKANAFNYTQIFEDSFRSSATQEVTRKWVAQNDRENEMGKIVDLLGVQMERALTFGKKQKPAAAVASQAGPAGAMGGIRSFITTNVYDKAGAALTQTYLEDALQDVWEAGGGGRFVGVVNAVQSRRIDQFLDAYRVTDYNDETLGTIVSRYKTRFGYVDFLLDRHMAIDEVLLLDVSRIGFGPLTGRQLSMTKRPVESSEANLWQIVGEYTCELRMEPAHARIHGLSTSVN